MSILNALQSYLSGCDGMKPMRILSGRVEKAESYVVSPTGNMAVEEDIVGNRTYENNYVFLARECVVDEADRRKAYDFLEGLFDWLESAPLPELPGDYTAEKITPSNIMLVDIDSNGMGIYQVQIKLRITKGAIKHE